MKNQLWYGDNLSVLRKLPDEFVDLIYLDPPFNSARNYNLLFKQHKGQDSPAQIMAFEDTWTWSPLAYQEFRSDDRNQPLWKLVASLYEILGTSEMMAYVVMMAPRLLELHRKLKPTGSLYLHCDPVASHYLKIILDVVFGPERFKNEVVWRRTNVHSDSKTWSRVNDTLLFYSKGSDFTWNPIYQTHTEKHLGAKYAQADESERRYTLSDMTSPNYRRNLVYSWKGFKSPTNGWRYSMETMQRLDAEGRIWYPRTQTGELDLTRRPRLKRYLDEMKGNLLTTNWTDISPINSQAKERRGYPTQKPLALLERIIAASSNPGDVVLDPFAGCGTAIVAAERMGRQWIGIDITYLAINEILDRLQTEKVEGKPLEYELQGTPKDLHSAEQLFKATAHQNHKPFEQWAVSLVNGRWNDKKGADRGVDGRIQLWDLQGNLREALVQVKGGALGLSQVRDFANVIASNNAVLGILIAMREPTKEMRMVAEQMGYADWPSERKYPRYQIYTVEELLEKGVRAEVPDSYRLQALTGVGKKVVAGQTSMDL